MRVGARVRVCVCMCVRLCVPVCACVSVRVRVCVDVWMQVGGCVFVVCVQNKGEWVCVRLLLTMNCTVYLWAMTLHNSKC